MGYFTEIRGLLASNLWFHKPHRSTQHQSSAVSETVGLIWPKLKTLVIAESRCSPGSADSW